MIPALLESSMPSNAVIFTGFLIVIALAWYGIRKTGPKPLSRIRLPREVDYKMAEGGWQRYRGRDQFGADHPERKRIGL